MYDVTRIGRSLRFVIFALLATHTARAADPEPPDLAAEILAAAGGELPNVAAPTLGGLQYWNDIRVVGDWRVQRNVLTGHFRLLDADNQRQAWGTRAACDRRLDTAIDNEVAKPARGEVVIVLHGLGSGRWAMAAVVKRLREAGFTVVDVGYSTTSGNVDDHAQSLERVINGLGDVEKLHFVAHSLGNLVTRHYFADLAANAPDGKPEARVGRMVMIAPPNQGSSRAKFWAANKWLLNTLGPTVKEMGPNWKELEPRLAMPPGEFGIIAGGLGNRTGFNLTIDGDDDGTLSVDETRLDGASDFAVVPCTHSLLVAHDDVLDYTVEFLRHGRFQDDK